ncbi:putative pteridine transporter ft5 [Leptomonas pyrrhocoris]|uniref:Putative pteridine transporter ft5 n=1 Tax=Leptomonas pyrrhocoris TaxID=157538 RepID=A0A0M9FU58_LEPPY|nr:putative pteridine transporter ft5 [Leptomonas pyrrhocoris]KPA75926.1 putative pteridine transporter ft5 [Leptomonas pyrrhocoris]|eukprot:XP_015654365.1 putative pteridine transporter ft5 [Leptomonas pyrrhocoris]
MVLLGIIVAAVIMGQLSDQNKTCDGVIASAVFHLMPAVVFAFNFYGERKNQLERYEDSVLKRQEARDAKNGAAQRQRCRHPVRDEEEDGEDGEDCANEPAGDDALCARSKHHQHEQEKGENAVDAVDEVAAKANAAAEGEQDEEADDDGLVGFSNDLGGVALSDDSQADDGDDDFNDRVRENIWVSAGCVFEINKEVVRANWKIVIYAVVMTCSVITLACVTILGTIWHLLYACIAVVVCCAVCAFLTLPRVIAKANMFVYCDMLFYIQLPGALDSFFLANEACLPGGPHFSYSFYNTVGAVIQNVAGMVGVILFTYVFSEQRYQVVMFVTVTLRVVASIFDLMVVERWNLYIGIPDHAMYICGDTIVYQICYMLNYMPVLMLLSRVVPHGSESMVYGLMAGIGNLGASMSNTIGSLLMELAWPIDTTTTPCDFSNVPWLIITGHLASPFLIVVASFVLLPHARVNDALDLHGHVVQKHLEKEGDEGKAAPDAATTSATTPGTAA